MLEFFGGLFMAFAGNIPGVSGGTIAFLMGFYDEMINSVNAFVSKLGNDAKSIRKKSFFFLLRLGVGYAIGLISCAFLISNIFLDYIYQICSLFLGITLASVPLVYVEELKTLKGRLRDLPFALLGIGAIVGITVLSLSGLIVTTTLTGRIVLGFSAGLLAACAMIVPGISGAAIFFIFGLYLPIFEGITALFHFDFSAAPLLASVGVGAVVGLLGVIKGVKWLLEHKRSQTVYAILGLMLGSLYSIWAGPALTALKDPESTIEPMNFDNFSPIFFILGIVLIVAFGVLKFYIEKRKKGKKS